MLTLFKHCSATFSLIGALAICGCGDRKSSPPVIASGKQTSPATATNKRAPNRKQQVADLFTKKRVQSDVLAVSQAVFKADMTTVMRFTHPRLIEIAGGEKKLKAAVEATVERLKSQGFKIESIKYPDDPTFFKTADHHFVIVPLTMVIAFNGRRVQADSFQLGAMKIGGKEWKYVDGAQLTPTLLNIFFPDFPESRKLPAVSRQELALNEKKSQSGQAIAKKVQPPITPKDKSIRPIHEYLPVATFAYAVANKSVLNSRFVRSVFASTKLSQMFILGGQSSGQLVEIAAFVTLQEFPVGGGNSRYASQRYYTKRDLYSGGVVRFKQKVNQLRVARAFLGNTKKAENHPGHNVYESARRFSRDRLVYFPDERTAVFGDSGAVYASIYRKSYFNRGSLKSLIKHAGRQDLLGIVDIASIRRIALQNLERNPLRAAYRRLRAFLEGGRNIILTGTHSSNDLQFRLQIDTISKAAARDIRGAVKHPSSVLANILDGLGIAAAKVMPTNTYAPALLQQKKLSAFLRSRDLKQDGLRLSVESKLSELGDPVAGIVQPLIGSAAADEKWFKGIYQMKRLSYAVSNFNELFQRSKDPLSVFYRVHLRKGRDFGKKPLLSWRVHILYGLEHSRLREQFNSKEPWDSAHNRKLIDKMPEVFRTPDNPSKSKTTFVVPRGKGTLAAEKKHRFSSDDLQPGFVIVRTTAAKAVVWTKPDDFQYDLQQPGKNLFAQNGGYFAVFSNAEAGFVSRPASNDLLRQLFLGSRRKPPIQFKPHSAELPSWRGMLKSAVYQQSLDRLRDIASAISEHGSLTDRFPALANFDAQGKPLLSWRVHLLKRLGQRELYEQFRLKEPWDSPHNRKLIKQIPLVYQRPGRVVDGKTNYLLPVSKHTVFPPTGTRSSNEVWRIGDGGSTIFVVEVDDKFAQPWTKPVDHDYDPDQPRRHLVGNYVDGFCCSMGTDAVVVRDFVREDVLKAIFSTKGNEDTIAINLRRVLESPKAQPVGSLPTGDAFREDRPKQDLAGEQKLDLGGTGQQTSKQYATLRANKNLFQLRLSWNKVDVKELVQLTQVSSLNLENARIDDSLLDSIGKLSKLRRLNLAQTKIKGENLQQLAALKNLEELNLSRNRLSTDKIAKLSKISSLKTLDLSWCGVRNEGLLYIGRMKSLKRLRLGFEVITDDGLKHLKDLKELAILRVGGYDITDKGLAALGSLNKLEQLHLTSPRATGSGFERFSKTDSQLYSVVLVGNKWNAAGLESLLKLQILRRVKLIGSQISTAKLNQLKGRHPKVSVIQF